MPFVCRRLDTDGTVVLKSTAAADELPPAEASSSDLEPTSPTPDTDRPSSEVSGLTANGARNVTRTVSSFPCPYEGKSYR